MPRASDVICRTSGCSTLLTRLQECSPCPSHVHETQKSCITALDHRQNNLLDSLDTASNANTACLTLKLLQQGAEAQASGMPWRVQEPTARLQLRGSQDGARRDQLRVGNLL